jgi:hypothetical protein
LKLIQALRNLSSKLNSEFEDSKLFEHSGEKGEFREHIISELLRPFLPDCYGLGSGQIFDNTDKSSNQIDIVIYDSVYSNVLFKNKSSSLFPCESVYGEIEIKSNLTSEELNTSIDNIASMKSLQRKDATMLDITPIYKLKLGNGLSGSTVKLNSYIGIVYGYDGITKETLNQKIQKKLANTDKRLMPDYIFNQKHNYVALKVKKNTVVGISDDFDNYAIIDTRKDTLTLMFLTINAVLNQIRLQAPDYNDYWLQVFNPMISKP